MVQKSRFTRDAFWFDLWRRVQDFASALSVVGTAYSKRLTSGAVRRELNFTTTSGATFPGTSINMGYSTEVTIFTMSYFRDIAARSSLPSENQVNWELTCCEKVSLEVAWDQLRELGRKSVQAFSVISAGDVDQAGFTSAGGQARIVQRMYGLNRSARDYQE